MVFVSNQEFVVFLGTLIKKREHQPLVTLLVSLFCGFVLSCCGLLSKRHRWALLYDLSNVPENRHYKLHDCVLQYSQSDSVSVNLITQIWENTRGFCLHACFFSIVGFYLFLQRRSFSVGRKLKNWPVSTRVEKDFSRSKPVREFIAL